MSTQESVQYSAFGELALRPELLATIAALGYKEPTPIQREAIPRLLEGRDLLGQAATGTGKTAAFALPLLNGLGAQPRPKEPSALVLVPTRELAMQVADAMHRYGQQLGARVLAIYGGAPMGRQLRALAGGIDVVVATPGRALDHLNRGSLALQGLRTVVLDEADEMLDMGFADELDAIMSKSPDQRQTLLFSATMPPRLGAMTQKYLRDPVRVQLAREPLPAGEAPRVRQTAYVVARTYKLAALRRVLDVEAPKAAIVFCRTRNEVDELTAALNRRGDRAEALHGGIHQENRERVMGRLRSGAAELLIATDVAARGLDLDHLTHVINFEVPSAPEQYIHRIGRVGRAGREGVAITLAEPREEYLLRRITQVTRQRLDIARLPSVADVRARRMDATRGDLAELLATADDLDPYREILVALASTHEPERVALAALKLAHKALRGEVDEREIPQPMPRVDRPQHTGGRTWAPAPPRGHGGAPSPRRRMPGTARIHIGAGRIAGIRPGDLVGAIANEAGLAGKEIGVIEISERFSLVDVPEEAAPRVIEALRGSTIKGRRASVRREHEAR